MKKMLIKLLSFMFADDIELIKRDVRRLNNEKISLQKRINKLKSEYVNEKFSLEKKIDRLKDEYANEKFSLEKKTSQLKNEYANEKLSLERKINKLKDEYNNEKFLLERQINKLKVEYTTYEDYSEFGMPTKFYNFETSQIYKEHMAEIVKEQKKLIKCGEAFWFNESYTLNGSAKKGHDYLKNQAKLLLRAFNGECETLFNSINYNNITNIEVKIEKSFLQINKLGKDLAFITERFKNLKIIEARLISDYKIVKQEEKEEQQRIKEQMKEEAKLQKELEEVQSSINKEKKRFTLEMEKLKKQLQKANEEEISALKNKIQELENGLEKVKQDEINLENRKNSTRAGYVYIISNVGSFGENIYKIGMTRRLDPQIRVDELGSASVPFKFDVHAFIFSEDAFELESKLHNHFDKCRVNKVNTKKEFFKVTLEEIENYVKTLDGTAKFNRTAAADEYRASLVV